MINGCFLPNVLRGNYIMEFINNTINYLKDHMNLVYAAAGAVLLLIIVLMIVLIVKSKKSKNKAAAVEPVKQDALLFEEKREVKPAEAKPEPKPAPAPREIRNEERQPAAQPKEAIYTAPAEPKREEVKYQEKQEVKQPEKSQPAPVKEQAQQKVYAQNTAPKPAQQQQQQPAKYAPPVNSGRSASALPLNKEMEKVLSGNESAKYTGKWVVFEKEGLFYYALYASNGELLVQSEGYSSDKGAISGISTFKRNLISGRFVVFEDKNSNFYFKLSSVNNRLIAVGQTYGSKQSCESSIESVKRFSQTAVFVNEIASK